MKVGDHVEIRVNTVHYYGIIVSIDTKTKRIVVSSDIDGGVYVPASVDNIVVHYAIHDIQNS